MAVDAVLRLKG